MSKRKTKKRLTPCDSSTYLVSGRAGMECSSHIAMVEFQLLWLLMAFRIRYQLETEHEHIFFTVIERLRYFLRLYFLGRCLHGNTMNVVWPPTCWRIPSKQKQRTHICFFCLLSALWISSQTLSINIQRTRLSSGSTYAAEINERMELICIYN